MQKTLYISIDTTLVDTVECEKMVKRGDTLVLQIKVFNNGVLADLTGQTIDLILRKTDNTIIQKTITSVLNGTITATLDVQATVVAGEVSGEIQLDDTNGQSSTNTFTFNVDASLANDVIEVSQNDIQVLSDLKALIADGQVKINTYENNILAIGNTVEAVEALANVKLYIDTNLPALQDSNAQATVNIARLESDNSTALDLAERLESDISIGNPLDSNLKQDIATGNLLHSSLQKDILDGNNVIVQLQNANWDYIQSMFNIIQIMIDGAVLMDENRNYLTDENGNYLIM